MSTPLVTTVTPTWQRHHLLLQRAIPSVRAQSYPKIQHIVCSDGPDETLADLLLLEPVTYVQVPAHSDHPFNYGSIARNHALSYATGEYIAYLDDDNAWRPDHLRLLAEALDENPEASFAYSQLITHPQGLVIGSNPPAYCGIDTSVIMHRRELLELARWPDPDNIAGDQHAPDWAIVAAWLEKGARWVHVPTVTVDYHFAGS